MAARVMTTVMRIAVNNESNGEGSKDNGNSNKVCGSKIVRTPWIPCRWEALN